MNTLPEGWTEMTLGEVALGYLSGGTPKSSIANYWDGAVPWTTSAAIAEDDLYLTGPKRYISDDGLANSSAKVIPKGNLLVGTRVGVGKAVVNRIDIAISQDLTGVLLDAERVNGEFLAYQFKTERVKRFFSGRKRGATIQGVSRSDLSDVPIKLRSLGDQETVVSILQDAQESIQVRRVELELESASRAALLVQLLTQGVGRREVKNSLTGLIPENWQVEKLGHLILEGPQNGIYKHQSAYGKGVSILRINDFDNDGRFVSPQLQQVELDEGEEAKYGLSEGDLVINRVNSLSHLGKSALITPEVTGAVFESNMMRIKVDGGAVLPAFIASFLLSDRARAFYRSRAKRAVAQSSINQSDVKSLPVPVPPMDEQREIADVIAACDEKAESLRHEIELHEELFQALLEELMTGQRSVAGLLDTSLEVSA